MKILILHFIFILCWAQSNIITMKQRLIQIRDKAMDQNKNSATVELRRHLSDRLLEDFDIIHRTNGQLHMDDKYDEGVTERSEKVILTGVRIRARSVGDFCGGLAQKQMPEVLMEDRDAILFKPAKMIPGPVVNTTIQIPRDWFQDPRLSPFAQLSALKIMVCYEGMVILRILTVPIEQNELTRSGSFVEFTHQNQFFSNLTIREVALLLDDRWNNRYLMPQRYLAFLIVNTRSEKRGKPINRECDRNLGLNQDCCLWKFSSTYHVGNSNMTRQIEFRRCVGRVPRESYNFFNENGPFDKVPRRLVMRDKVCRESRFNLAHVTRLGKHGTVSKTMNRLDAIECSVYY